MSHSQSFGFYLRSLIAERGMSEAEVNRWVLGNASRWFDGGSEPGMRNMQRLSDLLEIPILELAQHTSKPWFYLPRPLSDRDMGMAADHDNGMTYRAMAAKYGISEERVWQVLTKVRSRTEQPAG